MVSCDDYPKVDDNVWCIRLYYHASGALLKGSEFAIAGWPDEEGWSAVAACRTADQYLVVWHSINKDNSDIDGIYARDFDGDGTYGNFVNTVKYYAQYGKTYRRVDVACGITNLTPDNPGYLVTWAENPGYLDDILAREITPDGSMSDQINITNSGEWASVAGGAMNYLVVIDSIGIDARIVGNTRPRANFTVTPQKGTESTIFKFDASGTTDTTDDKELLEFRWDWEDDGIYDTTWTHNLKASHQYVLASWQMIKTYYPRLQVRDSRDDRDTTTQQVIVRKDEDPAPGEFNKISPSNGATGILTNPTLSWQSSDYATSYKYCYDTVNDGNCTNWTSTGTATSIGLSGLSTSTTYYWHVKAINSLGTTYSNGSSTAFWSFTTSKSSKYKTYLPLVVK